MRCAKCATQNPGGNKFCGGCGAPLANLCPKCGADNPPDHRFCGKCGAALGASPADALAKKPLDAPVRLTAVSAPENLEGERKTVTALFADYQGLD